MRRHIAISLLSLVGACVAPAGAETLSVYELEQRTLPGCLAAYIGVSAEKCKPTGPVTEYMAAGCDNETYLVRLADGAREAYFQGEFVGTFDVVVDAQSYVQFVDGAEGVCDFRSGVLTIFDKRD